MYEWIEIDNLRGIRKGAVRELAPLTVLVGPNNSGKSTVLEAFWAHLHPGFVRPILDLVHDRGWCGPLTALQIHHEPDHFTVIRAKQHEDQSPMETRFRVSEGWDPDRRDAAPASGEFVLSIRAEAGDLSSYCVLDDDGLCGPFATTGGMSNEPRGAFLRVATVNQFGQVEDAWSAAVGKGHESRLQALLPRLGLEDQRLRILKRGDNYVLHQVADDIPAVPIYFAGDGLKRMIFIACSLAEHRGSTILLEEPEAYQHPRYLDELAHLLWGGVEQGTQVILSTHSLDLLRLLFEDEARELDKAAVIRTVLDDGTLRTSRIAGRRAAERLSELEEDLRL